jgi:hypothetical protein
VASLVHPLRHELMVLVDPGSRWGALRVAALHSHIEDVHGQHRAPGVVPPVAELGRPEKGAGERGEQVTGPMVGSPVASWAMTRAPDSAVIAPQAAAGAACLARCIFQRFITGYSASHPGLADRMTGQSIMY